MDHRPPAGWSTSPTGKPTFVEHDASVFANPPVKPGFTPAFVGRHGVGVGTYTRWTYREAA